MISKVKINFLGKGKGAHIYFGNATDFDVCYEKLKESRVTNFVFEVGGKFKTMMLVEPNEAFDEMEFKKEVRMICNVSDRGIESDNVVKL